MMSDSYVGTSSVARKRARKNRIVDEEVDNDGFLKDIDVPAVETPAPSKKDRVMDVDAFFDAAYTKIGASCTPKPHRDCKLCSYVRCSTCS